VPVARLAERAHAIERRMEKSLLIVLRFRMIVSPESRVRKALNAGRHWHDVILFPRTIETYFIRIAGFDPC
jgi:hypothetical protein